MHYDALIDCLRNRGTQTDTTREYYGVLGGLSVGLRGAMYVVRMRSLESAHVHVHVCCLWWRDVGGDPLFMRLMGAPAPCGDCSITLPDTRLIAKNNSWYLV